MPRPDMPQDPQVEIYKAINDIAQEVSTGLIQLMENVKKTLEVVLHAHYERNKKVATARITAEDLLNPASRLPRSMDAATEKMVAALRDIHQNLAEANDENLKLAVMLQSLHGEPNADNPELQKAYIETTNKTLDRLSKLNEQYTLLAKEEATQALFLSDPKLMTDPDQAKAILNNFEEKVKPLLEKSLELKDDMKKTKEQAQEQVQEVKNTYGNRSGPA
jgi:lysophospholipase L1-like esterase